MKAHDALLYVFYQSGVKEIFHGSCSPSWVEDRRERSQQLSIMRGAGLAF
jgi:hypothetical protein